MYRFFTIKFIWIKKLFLSLSDKTYKKAHKTDLVSSQLTINQFMFTIESKQVNLLRF